MKPLRLIAHCAVLLALAFLMAAAQKPPAPASAALQVSDPVEIRIEGELKSMSPDIWIVGEFSTSISEETQIIEKRGQAEPGAWLIVWALSDPSGAPKAEIIVVDRASGASNPRVQFTDVLQKANSQWWRVGEQLVHVASPELIIGSPTEGSLVTVTAERQDPVLEATRIETAVLSQSPVPQDFEGTIEAIEKDRWQVDGRWVAVSPPATQINGTAALDKHAEVRVVVQADGSLFATVINIPETLEVTMGTLVADIVMDAEGAEVWDVSIFPDQLYADPYSATVHVDLDTLVDESRAVAGPGQWADVLAKPLQSGEFQAEVIRLEQPDPITVTGDLQQAATASGAGHWAQIGGRVVWFPDRMAGGVSAANGGQGRTLIEGVLLGNGVVWAQRVIPIENQTP